MNQSHWVTQLKKTQPEEIGKKRKKEKRSERRVTKKESRKRKVTLSKTKALQQGSEILGCLSVGGFHYREEDGGDLDCVTLCTVS